MAKRVLLSIPGVKLNETEYQILSLIAQKSERETGLKSGGTLLGKREMARMAGRCDSCVMRSTRSMATNGLVEVYFHNLENGAQVENEYRLTALGLEVLEQARIAVANGRVGVADARKRASKDGSL